MRLECGKCPRRVYAWLQRDHPVATRVLHQRVRRPKAHRLRVEQRCTECSRFVILDPRRCIDEIGERHRVALGKAVVREGRHLGEDLVGNPRGDATFVHAVVETLTQSLHARTRTLRPHRLAQLVRLGRGETGDIDGHLHQLLLEQRDTQCLRERVLEQRMQIGNRFETVATPDVGVHRAALNGAGTDECHLHDEVVERARLEAGQRGHLCA